MSLLEELKAESARKTANLEAAMGEIRRLFSKRRVAMSPTEVVRIVGRRARVPEAAIEVAISELTLDRELDYDRENNLIRP